MTTATVATLREPGYVIRPSPTPPPLTGEWEHPLWRQAEPLPLTHFSACSSRHRPHAQARVLYDEQAIYVAFRVEDRYVRSVCTQPQGPVCQDSCVEFFVQPRGQGPYFNFEINCGGTLHLSCVRDPTRTPHGFADFALLTPAELAQIQIYHSLPAVVEPELPGPVTWSVQFAAPVAVMEKYVGGLRPLTGAQWRANFYKCGDRTSHPHWATWAPVAGPLNFHVPESFAPLKFAAE